MERVSVLAEENERAFDRNRGYYRNYAFSGCNINFNVIISMYIM